MRNASAQPIPLPRLRTKWTLRVAVVLAILFAVLASDLVLHGPLTRSDAPISHWFSMHEHAWSTQLMLLASAMHGTVPLCVFAAALAAALVVLRQAHWVPLLLVTVPGGLLLNALVKLAFHRARPTFDHPLVTLTSFSFPSGHAAGATVWWGFLLVLYLAREKRAWHRVAAYLSVAAVVLLTATSRVYLGAHFPSDVLAGIAEGALWVLLCCALAGAVAGRREQADAARLA